MFNALKYIRKLEAVGISRDQAEAYVEVAMGTIEDGVATKSDIALVKSDIAEFKSEVQSRFSGVYVEFAKMRTEIASLENKLLWKLGTLMIACMTLQTGVVGLLITFRMK